MQADRERQREGGGVGESRGHVNRYMLETKRVFIHAAMHREMGEVMEERTMVTNST